MKNKLLFCLLVISSPLQSQDFSIGPRIFTEKGRFYVQEFFVYTKYNDATDTLLSTDFGYGITQNFGIQVNLPIIHTTLRDKKTTGFGDILALFQWHFFKEKYNVGIFRFGGKAPTSTTDKSINSRGRGAFAFVSDIGFIHSSPNWYAQGKCAIIATDKYKNIKTGIEARWSMSGGRKWHKEDFTFLFILTLAGAHKDSVKIDDVVVPKTSSDSMYIIPDIYFEKGDLSGGIGIGVPIMQNYDGCIKEKWSIGAILERKF